MRSHLTPARITVVRVAGEAMTDQEVFDCLKAQVPLLLNVNATLEISVKATPEQVDKAMRAIMTRIVGAREAAQIRKASGIK